MRRILTIAVLELYALALAAMQAMGGVRTDEAKYLLNIPYPHPPFVRWILGLTAGMPGQEILWRVVFATLMVQAVWMVWDMARPLPQTRRGVACGLWLFCGGVVLQAGTIMMACVTALDALVFLWLLSRPELVRRWSAAVGVYWLATLFSAYQGVLLLPLAVAVFRKAGLRWSDTALYVGAPLLLLALYTPTNPLAVASFGVHGARQLSETLLERLWMTGRVLLIGGSAVVTLLGLWGLVTRRSWSVLSSFILILLYVALSRYDYYAVLFAPFFVWGALQMLQTRDIPVFTLPVLAACSAVVLLSLPLQESPGPAREVMSLLKEASSVRIHGSFGHEWQYESPVPVRRYRPGVQVDLQPVVCLEACPEVESDRGYERLEAPVAVYVPRK